MRTKSRNERTLKLVMNGMFVAVAYATMFIVNIKIQFLTFDAKDAVIAIGGMLFGPISALVMSLSVSLIEAITISTTGIYGFLMNFLATAAFSCVSALIYKYNRSFKGALISLLSGSLAMTAVMLVFNLIVTPLYLSGTNVEDVIKMIPTLLLPFNLIKGIMNAGLTILLYKPLSNGVKRVLGQANKNSKYSQGNGECDIGDRSTAKKKADLRTIISVVISVAIIVVSLVVILVIMKGNIIFGKQ